jgi:hypothetical protein
MEFEKRPKTISFAQNQTTTMLPSSFLLPSTIKNCLNLSTNMVVVVECKAKTDLSLKKFRPLRQRSARALRPPPRARARTMHHQPTSARARANQRSRRCVSGGKANFRN